MRTDRATRMMGAVLAVLAGAGVATLGAATPTLAQAGVDTATPIANTGGAAGATSLALDRFDNPVIAYHDAAADDLKIVVCGNPRCSGAQTPILLDGVGDVGSQLSLALDSADRPVVAYYDASNGDLKLARCATADCTGEKTAVTVDDSPGDVGRWPSLALDGDGLAAIAYRDATNQDLRILRCINPTCTGLAGPVRRSTSNNNDGLRPSLVVDADNNPALSFHSLTDGWLRILRCTNPTCQGQQDLVFVDRPGTTDETSSSLVLDADDLPIAAYFHQGADRLRVVRCATRTCGDFPTPETPDITTGVSGLDPSLALASTDRPVVAYRDAASGDLGLVHCSNQNCSGTQQPQRPDTAGDVGNDPSMVLDADGDPVVAHIQAGVGLRLLRCADPGGCGGQDHDGDGVALADDNCADTANPQQSDLDNDGRGDACDDATIPSGSALRACKGMGPLNPIVGTAGPDVLQGTKGNDVIVGGGGDDIINGGGGQDCILGQGGADLVSGGGGNDTLVGGRGADVVLGGRGEDTLLGGSGPDDLSGGAGNDRLEGARRGDTLRGGGGDDELLGGSGRDLLIGGRGTDSCKGGSGRDTLRSC